MSTLFKLDWRDLLKGLFVAVFSSILTTISSMVQNSGFVLTKENGWFILSAALASGLAYLTKNLLTDSEGKVLGRI